MGKLLLLLEGLLACLSLGQTATDGASLLGTEIQGGVLLGLVEQTKLITLGLVDNSQDASNGLAGCTTRMSIHVRIEKYEQPQSLSSNEAE